MPSPTLQLTKAPNLTPVFSATKVRPSVALILLISFVSFVLVLGNSRAYAANVTLQWDLGSSPNIAGYRLYVGTTSRVYTQQIDVGNTTMTTVSSLVSGQTYFFAVTNYNNAGKESPHSNEVAYYVPTPTPTPGSGSTSGITAVSRKVHGSAGSFDTALPLSGAPGIECRSGGALGRHFVIVSFADTVTSLGSVSVTSGSGAIAASAFYGKQVGINLTGVRNAQIIIIRLSGVRLSHGSNPVTVSIPMAVLVGDTNADGFVDSIDTSQTKSQSGKSVNTLNFRTDINIDGFIDTLDLSMVRASGR